MIPPKDKLPEDPAEWQNIEVSFPQLPQNTAASCPIPISKVMDYVRGESADLDDARNESLQFIRTAQIKGSRYWLWSYTESDGEVCYVFLRVNEDGKALLSLNAVNKLSPELYLLAVHYEMVYW